MLTHRSVLRMAIPVMLAQAATAATGVVDTALIGLYGPKEELAAVAVGSVVIAFAYWAFGFLRMATTGQVAQCIGAQKPLEARAVLQRALLLGLVFGLALLALVPASAELLFEPFGVEPAVETPGQAYLRARAWGAPALLMSYGVSGWLLGMGHTRALLLLQIIVNGVNAALDWIFVAHLDMGPGGIGLGTAIAEWVALAVGLGLVWREIQPLAGVFEREKFRALMSANRDILIRTVALLFSFAWFVRSGAQFGSAQVAANEVLMQFVTVSAFVLDGYAFVAEKEVGEALGAKSPPRLRQAMRITTQLALASGILISVLYFFLGPVVVRAVISDVEARALALEFLRYCALIPVIGIFAWQLDGFFLGATDGRALRWAGIGSALLYVAFDLVLRDLYAARGTWLALFSMYLLRAACLGIFLPGLMKRAEG